MHTIYSNKNLLFFLGLFLTALTGFAQDDDFETDTHSKIRLGFYSHTGFYRQILLGFQNGAATDGIDPGYDAVNTFNLPDDMYFYCCNSQLFIQGVGYFNSVNAYPIGIKSNAQGNITIKLESAEYFNPSQTFYIYDSQTQQFHNLKAGSFTVSVGAGIFNDRFSLRFLDQAILGTDSPVLNNSVKVNYYTRNNELSIANNLNDVIASEVTVFNILGQQAAKWDIASQDQKEISISLANFSKGIYIVNVKTSMGIVTKKINIK